jgi:DNA-binding SARP family transcriptional activator
MRVQVLGGLVVTGDDGVVLPADGLPRRARQVLGVLAARHDRIQAKDALGDAVWGAELPGNHHAALEHYVSLLRRRLQPGVPAAAAFIVTRAGGYLFDTGRAALDLAELRDLVRRIEDGADLHGEVLRRAGEAFCEDPYAEWAEPVRAEVRAARLVALLHLAELARRNGEPARAGRLAAEAVELDPYAERAYQAAIGAARDLGRPDEARRWYERCRRILAEDLGIEPSPRTRELVAAPEPAPAGAGPGFAGRAAETAVVLGDAPAPVVHIVGPAGAGKSAFLAQLRRVAPRRVGLGWAGGGTPRLGWLRTAAVDLGIDGPDGDAALSRADLEALAAALDRPEPAVLAIDDADALDATSVAELSWLVRHRPGLRVVLAYRYPSVLADRPLAALGSPLVLRLAPLTAAELGAPVDASGGIPALLAAAGLPEPVAHAAAVQIARDRTRWMPDLAWQVLRWCATLGPLRLTELYLLLDDADAQVAELVDCVDRLVHAHLLAEDPDGRIRHRAGLLADAIAAQVSAAAGRRLRDRLAS